MCGERTCFCCSCFYYGDLIAEKNVIAILLLLELLCEKHSTRIVM